MLVDGLRICFLSRFFEEVSTFITEGCVKGIREAVALSASSVPDVVPSPSNEEGGQGQGADGEDEGEGKIVYC